MSADVFATLDESRRAGRTVVPMTTVRPARLDSSSAAKTS